MENKTPGRSAGVVNEQTTHHRHLFTLRYQHRGILRAVQVRPDLRATCVDTAHWLFLSQRVGDVLSMGTAIHGAVDRE
jgi:hypothetical protein